MKTILLAAVLACVSCSQFDYYADGRSKIEHASFRSFGGSSSLDTAGGTRLTQNHNKSAGQFFQTVTAIAGGISAASVSKSDNALKATQDGNLTKAGINTSNNNTKVILGAQKPVITNPDQIVTFPPK